MWFSENFRGPAGARGNWDGQTGLLHQGCVRSWIFSDGRCAQLTNLFVPNETGMNDISSTNCSYIISYASTCIFSSVYAIGEKLVNFMVEPKKGAKWPKELPKFKNRSDAIAVCKELCSRQYMHRSEKVAKGELEVRYFFAICHTLWRVFTWNYDVWKEKKNGSIF